MLNSKLDQDLERKSSAFQETFNKNMEDYLKKSLKIMVDYSNSLMDFLTNDSGSVVRLTKFKSAIDEVKTAKLKLNHKILEVLIKETDQKMGAFEFKVKYEPNFIIKQLENVKQEYKIIIKNLTAAKQEVLAHKDLYVDSEYDDYLKMLGELIETLQKDDEDLKPLINDQHKIIDDEKNKILNEKLDEVKNAFWNPQTVDKIEPRHYNRQYWIKGDFLSREKLGIREPDILNHSEFVVEYTIKEIDLEKGEIVVNVELESKANKVQINFEVKITGYKKKFEMDQEDVEKYAKTFEDKYRTKNIDTFLFDTHTKTKLYNAQELGVEWPHNEDEVEVKFKVITIDIMHGTLSGELLLKKGKAEKVLENIAIIWFASVEKHIAPLKNYFQKWTASNPFDLKNEIFMHHHDWWSVIAKINLDLKDSLFPKQIIDHLKWEPNYKSFDTLLIDDGVTTSEDSKGMKISILNHTITNQTIHFKNISTELKKIFKEFNAEMKMWVGGTNSHDTNTRKTKLIEDINVYAQDWSAFIKIYKTLKIKDVVLNISRWYFSEVKNLVLDTELTLTEEFLSTPQNLSKRGEDNYIHMQLHYVWLKLWLQKDKEDKTKTSLWLEFEIEGKSRNMSLGIHSELKIGSVEIY